MTPSTTRNLPTLPTEEIHRRGAEWFEQKVQGLVASCHPWHCVAIDVLTGEFEVAAEPMAATDRLRLRLPDAEIWMRRVGFPYVERIGYHPIDRPVELRRVEPKS